jgi:hypothetical protein
MVSQNPGVEREIIVSPADEALLRKACPDLDEWPMRWRYDEKDLAPGAAIVAAFKPFLLAMLHKPLAKRTFNRHRDNLWLVGGELIRRRRESTRFERMPIDKLIREMIDDDTGPLITSHISETLQEEVDATCRKYYRFMNDQSSSE